MRANQLFGTALSFLLLLAVTTAASAQVDAVTAARYDLKLGFTEGGKVAGTPVKPGDRVRKGQLLMQLEDKEGEALVALYKLRTESQVEVKAAEAKCHLAEVEAKRLDELLKTNAAAPYEAEKARVGAEVAKLEWDLAKQQHQEVIHQYEQATARHEKFLLRAPTDGAVETVTVSEGESVEPLKPVLRMVVIDPLWIDAAVPIEKTMKVKVGDPAWVVCTMGDQKQTAKGTIIFLAQVADGASVTRLIRVEMANPEGLPAGNQVSVSLTPPPGATAAKPEGGR